MSSKFTQPTGIGPELDKQLAFLIKVDSELGILLISTIIVELFDW